MTALANFLQIFIALHPFSLWSSVIHCYYYSEGLINHTIFPTQSQVRPPYFTNVSVVKYLRTAGAASLHGNTGPKILQQNSSKLIHCYNMLNNKMESCKCIKHWKYWCTHHHWAAGGVSPHRLWERSSVYSTLQRTSQDPSLTTSHAANFLAIPSPTQSTSPENINSNGCM